MFWWHEINEQFKKWEKSQWTPNEPNKIDKFEEICHIFECTRQDRYIANAGLKHVRHAHFMMAHLLGFKNSFGKPFAWLGMLASLKLNTFLFFLTSLAVHSPCEDNKIIWIAHIVNNTISMRFNSITQNWITSSNDVCRCFDLSAVETFRTDTHRCRKSNFALFMITANSTIHIKASRDIFVYCFLSLFAI